MIEEFLLNLFPTINGTMLKVHVTIESIDLKGAHKLFDKIINICASIVACFNEVCYALFYIFIAVEMLQLRRLIANI